MSRATRSRPAARVGGSWPRDGTAAWVHHERMYVTLPIWRHMPYDVQMHRTTIVLPDDLDRRLSDAARRRGSSRTEVLRQALSAFLEADARPRPRSVGLGRRSGPRVTSENVKASVRAEWRDGQRAR